MTVNSNHFSHSHKSGYQAPAVGRAFQILKHVAKAPDAFSLTKIANDLGLSKSTTHGLVHALLSTEALDYSPGQKKFFLGPAIMDLALNSFDTIGIRQIAQTHLDDLRDLIGETIFIGGLNRRRAIIMAMSESTKPFKITAQPGVTIPILAGAIGKIFLSRFSDEEALNIIRTHGLKRYTDASIIDETDYLVDLSHTRKRGWATDHGEYLSGVHAVALNLGNRGSLPLAMWAVGLAGSINNGTVSQVASAMLETANNLRAILKLKDAM